MEMKKELRNVKQALSQRFSFDADQITWGSLGDVQGDPHDLFLLFEALLANALTYAHPDRRAVIRIRRVDHDARDDIRIVVSDNGRGIPVQHVGAVLELFSRLHTYADVPGTGLGLSLCRRVMERHNGTIRLSSEEGRSTQVTLCFPKGGDE